MKRHISEEEMFRLIDREYSTEEQSNFELHISQCADCKALYTEISSLDVQLHQMMLETPSKDFTERLLEKWQEVPVLHQQFFYTKSYSIILAPVAFVFGLLLVLLSGFSLGWFNNTGLPIIGQSLNMLPYITDVQFLLQHEWFINIFIFMNCILALLIFDKAILQPYFKKKINQMTR